MSFENPETLNFKPIMVSINKGVTPRGEFGHADMKLICDKHKIFPRVIRSIVRTILETGFVSFRFLAIHSHYTVACSYMVESFVAPEIPQEKLIWPSRALRRRMALKSVHFR